MLTELFIGPGMTFQQVYLRTKISQPEWLHSSLCTKLTIILINFRKECSNAKEWQIKGVEKWDRGYFDNVLSSPYKCAGDPELWSDRGRVVWIMVQKMHHRPT